jgi:hypothetical protein
MLAQTHPVSARLKVLRDKVFAHRSASLSYDDVFAEAQITPNQLRDLTSDALRIANSLMTARGLPTEQFHDLARIDAETLLTNLASLRATS